MIYPKSLSLFYLILFFLNINLLLALAERPVDESIDDKELFRNDPLGKAFEYDLLLPSQTGSANNNKDPLRALSDTEYDLLDNLTVDSGTGLGPGPTVGSTSGSTVDSTTGSNNGSTIGGSTSSNTTGDIQTDTLSETPEVVTNETFQVIVTSEEATSSSEKPESFPFSKNTVMFIFSFVLALCLLVCGGICCMSLGRQRTESGEEKEEEISLAEKGISSPEESVSSRKKRFRELIEKEPFKCEKRKKSQELIDLKKAGYKVTSLADHNKMETLTLSETFPDGTREMEVVKEITKVEDDGTVKKKISKEFITFPEQSPSSTRAEVAEVLDTMASIQQVGEKLIKDQMDNLKLVKKKSQEVMIKGEEMLKESQTPSKPVSTTEQSPTEQSPAEQISSEQVQVEQVAEEQEEVTIEPVTQQESQVLRKIKITKPSLEAITAVTPKRPEKLLTMIRPESVQELIDFKTSEYKVTDHGKMETITITETFPDGTKKMEILKEITRVEDDGTDRLVKRSISKELITFPKQNIQQTEQELANLLQPITSIDQRTEETVKKQVAELSLIDQAKDLLEQNKEQVVSSEIQLTEPVTEQEGEIPYEEADWEEGYIPSYEGEETENQDENPQTESVSSDEKSSSSSTEKSESSEEKGTK